MHYIYTVLFKWCFYGLLKKFCAAVKYFSLQKFKKRKLFFMPSKIEKYPWRFFNKSWIKLFQIVWFYWCCFNIFLSEQYSLLRPRKARFCPEALLQPFHHSSSSYWWTCSSMLRLSKCLSWHGNTKFYFLSKVFLGWTGLVLLFSSLSK